MAEPILEAEYANEKGHIAFMTGQIVCKDGGSGRIQAELFDAEGQRRFDLVAGAHHHADPSAEDASNTLTLPVPPGWKAKCYRIETAAGVETRWAEID